MYRVIYIIIIIATLLRPICLRSQVPSPTTYLLLYTNHPIEKTFLGNPYHKSAVPIFYLIHGNKQTNNGHL